jgi:hypothetical protein
MSTLILPTPFFLGLHLIARSLEVALETTGPNTTVNPEVKKMDEEERRAVGLLLPSALAKVEEDRKRVHGRCRVVTPWELWSL